MQAYVKLRFQNVIKTFQERYMRRPQYHKKVLTLYVRR